MFENKHLDIRRWLLLVLAPLLISCATERRRISSPPVQPHHDAAAAAVQQEYASLHALIRVNNERGMDAWTMNSEHLFAGEGDVRDRVIRFVRMAPALDMLYGRLLDPATDADEVLVIAELLVYHGQYHLPGDDRLKSQKTDALKRAVDAGRLKDAQRMYPDAPIKDHVLYSIEKARRAAAEE